ncbi:MAG: hypothetical protein KF819_06815 [Labilithrix sp.]|nr:hypothetical protein [Labilithrix sp.]
MALGRRLGALVVTSIVLLGTLASCTETANISDVYMALDGQGNRRRNVFFTDSKEIHCVVEMGVGRPGVTVEVLIRGLQNYDFIEDKFFDTDRVLANAEESPQPGNQIQRVDVEIQPISPLGEIDDEAPYPPGRYQCEAYLDGVLQRTAIFNIDFPPCPAATILPATRCYGFYTENKECGRYGLTSRDPTKCRCAVLRGWECDP